MRIFTLLLLLLPCFAFAAPADDDVKYRQSIMNAMKWHLGKLSMYAKGEKPYDPKQAKRLAYELSILSNMITYGFTPITKGHEKSSATEAVFTDTKKFADKAKDFDKMAGKLRAASKNIAEFKTAFKTVGEACSDCHNTFKKK